MDVFAFYALMGFLLLILLEIFFLILVAALTRKSDFVPKITVPELKGQERYGWEDILKLSPERKPSGKHNVLLAVIIIILLLLILAVPGWFLVAPPIQLNLSNASFGQHAGGVTNAIPIEVNESGRGIFSNITLPRLNLTAPSVNLSGVFTPLMSNLKIVVSGLVAVLVALAVFVFFLRRRNLAVIRKAKKTAEKLIREAKLEKAGKPPVVQGVFFSGLAKFKDYLAPVIILLLLVVIAFLVYLLRDRIRNEFSDKLLSFAVSAKEFALNYRLYILAGIVVLVICMLLLRLIAKRQQKPA